jgi:hypothetical protein
MKYDARLRRLEQIVTPPEDPHIVVHFVDPQLGLLSALGRMTHT